MSNKEVVLNKNDSENLLLFADQLIQQGHYKNIDQLSLVPVGQNIEALKASNIICLFQIKELVCNKEKGSFEAFSIVLNALHACGATCLMLLEFREGTVELYIGAANKNRYQNVYYLNTIREILSSGIQGNLPGTEIKELVTRKEIDDKVYECLGESFDTQCITAVSCVADEFKQGESLYGMEKLLEAIGKKNFSLLVLADPIDNEQLQTIRIGYEELGSQLSEIESLSISTQMSKSSSISENLSDSISHSIGESISYTQSHNITSGWNSGENVPNEKEKKNLGKKMIAGAGALTLSALTENPMVGYMFMNVVSSAISGGTKSSGLNVGVSDGRNETIMNNEQMNKTHQESSGISKGETQGISIQFMKKNRHVQELLEKLELYLKWLNKCENFGMFNCCTYIISGSASTNLLVSSQYQAILQGEGKRNQPIAFNTWTKENNIDIVRDSLMHMMHPSAKRGNIEISPAMLISSKELSRQMILPQESVVGVSVMEYAAFGKEVVRKSPIRSGKIIKIGSVFHMGKTNYNQPVFLDIQSLAAHTFIAGTNGAGKSNTIFSILEKLLESGIPFMVIEPAKGEYKNVFGNEINVRVFGTNKQKTPLLRINPFWFNEDINIKEHIARLMDVFNASWPMYAAMPSILNASIENAYRACGWNLNTSKCMKNRIFPTVKDVQKALNEKMESTAFSDEVRGNYIGALSSRLESLTNGIYADIFSGADIGDRLLFESNVLIDLSRAGSSEISAMIMGVLLIRLREYRMSEGAINHPLRHVTVLEEAHHLLRKTSMEQSGEESNIMGKSVEMISNAIAEMRSYGDGFIIADQSPGLLDMSVLRNTNTKILMRLPEGGDRDIVANTIGLSQKQTYELSRLKTGICAIYQKDWLETVLCQVDLAKHEEKLYSYKQKNDEEDLRHQKLLDYMITNISENKKQKNDDDYAELVCNSAFSGNLKKKLLSIRFTEPLSWAEIADLLCEIEPLELFSLDNNSEEEYESWIQDIYEVNDLPDTSISKIIVAANVKKNCKKNPEWKKLSDWLYLEKADFSIPDIRGRALAWILLGNENDDNMKKLNKLEIKELSQGWEADCKLAEKYIQYERMGKSRQRGEIIGYSEIAWAYAGGNKVWTEAYHSILNQDYAKWDENIRTELKKNVQASDKVINFLLSLVLQNKGTNKEVRGFYYSWLAWTRNKNTM